MSNFSEYEMRDQPETRVRYKEGDEENDDNNFDIEEEEKESKESVVKIDDRMKALVNISEIY